MKNLQSDIACLYEDSADLSDTAGIFSQLLQRIEEIEDKLKVKPMQESYLITPLMEDQIDETPKLDFDNIIPENTPWNSEGWDAPSGKKKAQWKSEVNGRKHK